MLPRTAVTALLVSALVGCSGSGADDDPAAVAGTHVLMDATLADGFFTAPFPLDSRVLSDGHVDVAGFPNPTGSPFLEKLRGLLTMEARGFGTTSGVFFQLDAPLSESLAIDYAESLNTGAGAFLVAVDGGALLRHPVSVAFHADGGPFGAPNLLSLLALQGAPLRPKTTYAAVVLRSLGDAQGAQLGVSKELVELRSGKRPPGYSASVVESYANVFDALGSSGFASSDIAGLAVFTTDDPTSGFRAVLTDVLAATPPVPKAAFTAREVFPDFCVYDTTIDAPVYQGGTPPYQEDGGGWVFDASGKPQKQRDETARFVVTIPRAPMPAAGYPIVLMSRTGGGGDRPLVDRGPRAVAGGAAIAPGTGPAQHFARAGFGGATIDGPHGGPRNVTGGDEQFLMFNVTNPAALRDNVRQSAVELALWAHVLGTVHLDVSACPGATTTDPAGAHLDTSHLGLMGHSMGATIAPLALAFEPAFGAAILSGEGGSWIENVIYKKKPLPVKGFAELLLGVAGQYSLHEHDPALSLFQWAAEPADPPVYARYVVQAPEQGAPRSVLMLQGIVDTYILPPIANASSLSLGLDLAGDGLDATSPGEAAFVPLGERLQFSGRGQITLPASGNFTAPDGTPVTAVVVQHPEDGIEDGHEVMFQTDPPKKQYRCFLSSWLTGTPRVPLGGAADEACD